MVGDKERSAGGVKGTRTFGTFSTRQNLGYDLHKGASLYALNVCNMRQHDIAFII